MRRLKLCWYQSIIELISQERTTLHKVASGYKHRDKNLKPNKNRKSRPRHSFHFISLLATNVKRIR